MLASGGLGLPQNIGIRTDVIRRISLQEELVSRIRTLIIRGELASGERLQEKELSERFGVSRTPLREALKVLSGEGFVNFSPNRGATVSSITDDNLREIYPILAELEALAGRLTCENATDEQINEILVLTKQMVEFHRTEDLRSYFRININIHLAIAKAASNDTLEKMLISINQKARRGRYQANLSKDRWDQAVEEHCLIAETLEKRDCERLAQLLRTHLNNKFSSFLLPK
jgi:DNA-binding GntR family transcriptional regulator